MKKIIVFVFVLFIAACKPNSEERDYFTLPDLNGRSKEEIIDLFIEEGQSYQILVSDEENYEQSNLFKDYIHLNIGDIVYKDTVVGVYVYKKMPPREEEIVVSDEYYVPSEFVYDGPYLDEEFNSYPLVDTRGGYGEVTLSGCVDGDTALFIYPDSLVEALDGYPSTRFFLIDTEETYNNPEEWGKPASVYTCELLLEATSIVVQTDPNDGLTDHYGRLLAWIWVEFDDSGDYQSLNYILLRQGLASVKYEFGSGETIYYGDYTYSEWMHIGEDYAIEHSIGMHGELLDYYWDYDNDGPDYTKWNE